jgi:hyperosmotically inducible protein
VRARILATLVAAALAACSDEPPVRAAAKAGARTLPVAVQPAAAPEAAPRLDENAALAARVLAALRGDPAVAMLGIDVVTAEGVVTLFGTAPTNRDRDRAARVAAGVDGVRSVMNHLVIVAGS